MMYSEKASRERIMRRLGTDQSFWSVAAAEYGVREAEGLFCRTPTYLLEKLEETMTAEVIPHPSMPAIEQAFSLDNLTEGDKDALVLHLSRTLLRGMLLSEDSMDLESLMTRHELTPVALWNYCASSTVIPVMIAAYALRGVTRLPDDPRLDPLPHSRAPVKAPRNAEEAARRRREPQVAPATSGQYLAWAAPNPKRVGSASYDRYALYTEGLSREALRGRGLTSADFKHDTERGFVRWRDTAEELTTEEPLEGTNDDEELEYNEDIV